jgi:hypothetical protein
MKKLDALYIDGSVFFDDSLNGWYKKSGSYEMYIILTKDDQGSTFLAELSPQDQYQR